MIDLKNCEWCCSFVNTINTPHGDVDLYVIIYEEQEGVTLGVPKGRKDIADFIVRSCKAGQQVFRQLEKGEPFVVDEAVKRKLQQ